MLSRDGGCYTYMTICLNALKIKNKYLLYRQPPKLIVTFNCSWSSVSHVLVNWGKTLFLRVLVFSMFVDKVVPRVIRTILMVAAYEYLRSDNWDIWLWKWQRYNFTCFLCLHYPPEGNRPCQSGRSRCQSCPGSGLGSRTTCTTRRIN